MPASAVSASLNRFPGLTLLGFALWKGGVLYRSQGISAVTDNGMAPVFTFTTPVASANFIVDAELGGPIFGRMSAKSVNGFTLSIEDINGAPKNLPELGFVAVYG